MRKGEPLPPLCCRATTNVIALYQQKQQWEGPHHSLYLNYDSSIITITTFDIGATRQQWEGMHPSYMLSVVKGGPRAPNS
jgi:hypothetical protein